MAEILRHSPHLLHFRAEVNPFLVLAGHGWPESGTGSDALVEPSAAPDLERLLEHDCGRRAARFSGERAIEGFARELHWRLSLQWPLERFHAGQVHQQVQQALQQLQRHHGWAQGTFPDPARFHALFLGLVRRSCPAVNPWYYDLPPALIRQHSPAARPSQAPPSPVVFEEPPFITTSPWRAPSDAELEHLPLVIKTPSNAYRLDFLRALFPNARLRLLHLTRNAAASINGLVDGWTFRGFFAHYMPGQLHIQGYSDRSPGWARDWWKFDLPPGWREYRASPLVEVCGHQWRSAHRAVLGWARQHQADLHRTRFEHVVGSHAQRLEAFEALVRWLGVPFDDSLARLVETGLPPIMATTRPRHRRWFEKAALLEPVLVREDTRDTMERLGYDTDRDTWI